LRYFRVGASMRFQYCERCLMLRQTFPYRRCAPIVRLAHTRFKRANLLIFDLSDVSCTQISVPIHDGT
jgi:hypothetical protein